MTKERYGTSCLCCHANEFGVAGSLPRDAGVSSVVVVDRDGRSTDMASDVFDNFFQHRQLTPPLRATVRFADGAVSSMKGDAPHGSCNACHGVSTPLVGQR